MVEPSSIEIEDLREAGLDGGGLMGFYCRGHVDRYLFAKAANDASGARTDWDRRHVRAEEVHHIWWRTVPIAGEPGMSRFVDAEPHSRGAWAATVWTGIQDRHIRQARREVTTFNMARIAAFARGVQWAINTIDGQFPDAADKLLRSYRAQEPEKTDG